LYVIIIIIITTIYSAQYRGHTATRAPHKQLHVLSGGKTYTIIQPCACMKVHDASAYNITVGDGIQRTKRNCFGSVYTIILYSPSWAPSIM